MVVDLNIWVPCLNDRTFSSHVSLSTRLVGMVVTVLTLFALSGCGQRGIEERRWKEEVRLDDGVIVQIERHITFDESKIQWTSTELGVTERSRS